jgi:hypothetical protein
MKLELTTSGNELVKRVELKLSAPFSGKCTLFFAVFPSLGTDHFSIQLIESEIPFLVTRRWIVDFRNDYPLGVYNLNDIQIEEKQVQLSFAEYEKICEIIPTAIIIEDLKGIILDGEYFHLILDEKEYHWRMMYQISEELCNLLNKLMDLAGFSR